MNASMRRDLFLLHAVRVFLLLLPFFLLDQVVAVVAVEVGEHGRARFR